MALVRHNTTLEYANNIVQISNYNELGEAENFPNSPVTLTISRVDGVGTAHSLDGDVTGNIATFSIVWSSGGSGGSDLNTVYSSADNNYAYDDPVYEHTYSISDSDQTYVYGKLNLVSIA